MPEQVEAATQEQLDQQSRELPDLIVIPSIKGEMVHLRPSVIEDLERMDAIGAYIGASGITGKDRVAERGAVHAWVRRSVAWSQGETPTESGVGDPESRRTIAWSIITEADHDGDGEIDAANSDNVIGMIFLIDIDGWARSARIQVVRTCAGTGRPWHASHLGCRARAEHAFRVRVPVVGIRAVRSFARRLVERFAEPLPGSDRYGHAG